MGIDIGKNLKNALQGAADMAKNAGDSIMTVAKDAGDSIASAAKDVKLPDVFKSKDKEDKNQAEEGKETTEETALAEQKTETSLEIKQQEEQVEEQVENTQSQSQKKQEEKEPAIRSISTKAALKIFYYLMAADGQLLDVEMERFDSIGMELDANFAEYKDQIIQECKQQLDKLEEDDEYYDIVQDGVENAIYESMQSSDNRMSSNLLVWDLITIAYSDHAMADSERKLLKYIVRKLRVDKSLFQEMEHSYLTIVDLENEINWIKTTDKKYLEIEAIINEIQDRKNVIFESVQMLITL